MRCQSLFTGKSEAMLVAICALKKKKASEERRRRSRASAQVALDSLALLTAEGFTDSIYCGAKAYCTKLERARFRTRLHHQGLDNRRINRLACLIEYSALMRSRAYFRCQGLLGLPGTDLAR
jgi:hypothetical protein